jgi:hypothetical protein
VRTRERASRGVDRGEAAEVGAPPAPRLPRDGQELALDARLDGLARRLRRRVGAGVEHRRERRGAGVGSGERDGDEQDEEPASSERGQHADDA